MSNSINWTGNRVFDHNVSRTSYQPAAMIVPAQQSAPMPQSTPVSPAIPSQPSSPAAFDTIQGPPPATEKGFIPYYLASNIGKNVRAEFIVGSNQYVDKTGVLIEVGINYFVLKDVNSKANIMCDLYSVKFVTILQQ